MIRTEYYMTRDDGVVLVRTYSVEGFKIRQNGTGAIYEEAIDPEDSGRTYTETDEMIPDEDIEDSEALRMITGGAAE